MIIGFQPHAGLSALRPQHAAAAASSATFESAVSEQKPSLARQLYDSVNQFDETLRGRLDALSSLMDKMPDPRSGKDSPEIRAWTAAHKVISTEVEISSALRGAERAAEQRTNFQNELPNASGQRREFLLLNIPSLAEYTVQQRERAEELQIELGRLLEAMG